MEDVGWKDRHNQSLLMRVYDSILVVLIPAIQEGYGGEGWGSMNAEGFLLTEMEPE